MIIKKSKQNKNNLSIQIVYKNVFLQNELFGLPLILQVCFNHDCAYACVIACWYVNIELRATEYKIELFFNFIQLAIRKCPVRARPMKGLIH